MKIKIWDKVIPYILDGAETPNEMTFYSAEGQDKDSGAKPCVVVFPGGAYSFRAPHEGEPIARFFNRRGLHAAVAEYRVAPNRYPSGLADAQRAIRLVRANAQEWGVDPERIVVCGFSAGGHLAASAMLTKDVLPPDFERDAVDMLCCTPNGGILCYPVISIESEYGHTGSGKNLLGTERYATDAAAHSLQNCVTEHTPKAFLWHTSDDASVNVKNSLIFCEKLRENNIPFELHIYPHGKHGLGLATEQEDVCHWADQAADWIFRNI